MPKLVAVTRAPTPQCGTVACSQPTGSSSPTTITVNVGGTNYTVDIDASGKGTLLVPNTNGARQNAGILLNYTTHENYADNPIRNEKFMIKNYLPKLINE